MMRYLKKELILLLLLSSIAGVAMAKEQYVIDVLYITLRAGQGDEYKVLRALKSGTRLEILEVSGEGYSRVRAPNGKEGWVKTKYLTDKPVAIIQVKKLQAINDQLLAENNRLKEKSLDTKQRVKEAEKERKRLESKSQKLQTENKKIRTVSAKPMELARENDIFRKKNKAMESELEAFRRNDEVHSDKTSRDWFITGAGVLILGMVIGLILPSIRWRKKNSW